MENNNRTNECPCEAVRSLQRIVEKHEEQLNDGKTQFATINTKLNFVIGIMSAVGVAVLGVVVKIAFA